MPAEADTAPMSREQFVLTNTQLFSEMMTDVFLGPDGVNALAGFAETIQDRTRKAGREFTAFVNDKFKDDAHRREHELTRLADMSRSMFKRITELKEDVAKLKANGNDRQRRLKAGTTMGYLRSQCEAIENLML